MKNCRGKLKLISVKLYHLPCLSGIRDLDKRLNDTLILSNKTNHKELAMYKRQKLTTTLLTEFLSENDDGQGQIFGNLGGVCQGIFFKHEKLSRQNTKS